MKIEEVLKLAETISLILHQTDRDDLIEPLIQLVDDYERINDEIATFVHGEVESSSSSEEFDDKDGGVCNQWGCSCGECPEAKLNDKDTTIEGDKVKVDDEGFHSIE
tara:strand:- start:357 stop:677 length:321 start_codon:yes stop_codon:yes gene_type:complete